VLISESQPVPLTNWDGKIIVRLRFERLRRDKEEKMKKYVCDACGYIYDPVENNNVAFDDLPEDWICPVCGVGKDLFSPIDKKIS